MTIKSWLRTNRFTLALVGAVFAVEVALLLLRLGPGTGQFIYWWVISPVYFCTPVVFIAIVAIAICFRIKPRSWYLRTVFSLPFILILLAGLLESFQGSPVFRPSPYLTNGSFHGHVYYLGFEKGMFSGDEYGDFYLYECDSIGFWCHQVDRISVDMNPDPDHVVLAANPANDTLDIKWAGSGIIMREYAPTDSLPATPNPVDGP